jgi:transcriptional regulator with XRE-family HTH domain
MARETEPPPPELTSQDVLALRKELKLTQKDLALRLGVDTPLVVAWERGDEFPTLDNARKLVLLREGRPLETRPRRIQNDPLKGLLNDPEYWAITRKLLAHRELYDQVRRLAKSYADPAGPAEPSKDAS